MSHDAIVLAGGTGRRLGGASKPALMLHGRRLLDHALTATAGARSVAVVAPDTIAVPDGVLRTLEDPPHGGPVAGIAAGLAALDRAAQAAARGSAPLTLVLACDIPGAASAVPRLLARAVSHPDAAEAISTLVGSRGRVDNPALGDKSAVGGKSAVGDKSAVGEAAGGGGWDGVVVQDVSGRDQWLVGLYRTDQLRERLSEIVAGGGLTGCPVRELVRSMRLVTVVAKGREAADIDTWEDLRKAAVDPWQ
ncbi:NTP transferase domain-containing protein [Georgenia sp. MJ173]